jgi:hypothetical protein
MHAIPRNINVFCLNVTSVSNPIMFYRSYNGRAHPHVRIKYDIAFICHRKHKPFDKLDRKLAGVDGFFDVVVFYIRKNPEVSRILA